MDELSNKVAIVTGSTKGIGRSIAHLFSKNGARVIVTSRSLDVARNIVKELRPYGNEALAIKLGELISYFELFFKLLLKKNVLIKNK